MAKHPSGYAEDHGLDEIETLVQYFLNEERARLVRLLRVDFGCSWRAVAERVAYVYPDSDIVGGHQLYGEALCRRAANLLNEDPNQAPWN